MPMGIATTMRANPNADATMPSSLSESCAEAPSSGSSGGKPPMEKVVAKTVAARRTSR
jgi:hypothetical protein